MSLKVLSLPAVVFAAFAASARPFDVTAFGAKPDGVTDSTAAIQRAIDECSAAGGGRVLVPGGGVYKTYTLRLKNNVELHLDRGATLKSGEAPLKFPEFAPTDVWHVERAPRFNRRAMFYTCGQTNVAITGAGTIDGNAEAYHHREDGYWRRNSDTNICGRCVFFVGCRDVRFDDVLVYHPCGWSTWFLDCDRVQVKGVRIECHREFPNGDGLHFGGCRDVTVSDCLIDAQDDALIVRTHQEQMRKARPCERMTFANCVLRSNQSAIRIGWTGDGPIRDVRFDNIVCQDSRLGVQFFLPPLPDAPAEWMDPPRGRGLAAPPPESLAPFSVENLHFSNLSINSFVAPFFIDIGATENVAFLKNISFSNCRFTSQQPPITICRVEDNVRDWRFSGCTFDIARPRGQPNSTRGVWGDGTHGLFENARDIVFDNVKWTWREQETPEWYLTLEQTGGRTRAVRVLGARQRVREETGAAGGRVFVCDELTDGCSSWQVEVRLEETFTAAGRSWRGKIVNRDRGIRITGFEGPYFDALALQPKNAALYLPHGLGVRLTNFPAADAKNVKTLPAEEVETQLWSPGDWYRLDDQRFTYDTGYYPGASGLTMPWSALETGRGTWYVGSHDPHARPKRLRFRWTPGARRLEAAVGHRFFLEAGGEWTLPETACEKMSGDWHDAAKRYRVWYDTVHRTRTATPAWTAQIVGQLLVIMRQQNGQLFWPYTDIPKLCDVAERNGLDCIGLFGWTESGHDHNYPDYIPSVEAGGVAALKAGIAEAHRRGLKVYIYANGQLQHVGATEFWRQHGEKLALINRDGTRVIQTYHKYSDIPKYEFALGCLHGKPWYDRMYSLAEQALGFGADGILYDQLGIFSPFACYGVGHGHPAPGFSYGAERPGFIRSITDAIRSRNADFAVLTEGLHDTILDSIGLFHGCEKGCFLWDMRNTRTQAKGGRPENFPELWRYTFPELVTSLRFSTPMLPRGLVNYAAVYGCRHDMEIRYAPDREYVLNGKVPTKADYGTVIDVPNVALMASVKQTEANAYLKSVCDFQRAHAKYLLAGRFVDDEGFRCDNPSLLAKRFLAADGTSAVCVWNLSDAPAEVKLEGLGTPSGVYAPSGAAATGALAGDSLRLYVFANR